VFAGEVAALEAEGLEAKAALIVVLYRHGDSESESALTLGVRRVA
jgi:hypothetical protein